MIAGAFQRRASGGLPQKLPQIITKQIYYSIILQKSKLLRFNKEGNMLNDNIKYLT